MVRQLIAIFAVLICSMSSASAAPIQTLPGLLSVSVFEQTGSVTEHIFAPTHLTILSQRSGALSGSNNDFRGVSTEYYDVFYSNADGTANTLGAFLTIRSQFVNATGGALNINGVRLNFAGAITEFANVVTAFISGGNNAFPATVGRAVDGNLATTTSLGSTFAPDDFLSLTVGFASTAEASVPVPGALLLFGSGLIGLCIRRSNKIHA